jgi:predicted MFS family arabinose efflux permease
MAIATFPIIVVSVLAAQLISEFEITRAQLGLLVTSTALVGALMSPVLGRVTDRIGGVPATKYVLLIGIGTLAALALAPTYAVLVAAALATGIPNGWSNPATNTLISDNVAAGARGIVTGVKQSGVQIGTFLGGLLVPVFAALWNWRVAVLAFLVIPVLGLAGMWGRHSEAKERPEGQVVDAHIPVGVRWIAVYGFLSGLATSAIFGFLPLFAEEDQLWSRQAAGSLVAVVGLMGIAARILWPRLAERFLGHGRTLRIVAALSAGTTLLLALAAVDVLESWVLVPAALLLGAGAIAWNAVGMLAVMDFSPPGMVGKGTGTVLLGFLLGLAGGAPLMGFSVDVFGSYQQGWLGAGLLLVAGVLVAGKIPAGSTVGQT